jgi:hypothetical protein
MVPIGRQLAMVLLCATALSVPAHAEWLADGVPLCTAPNDQTGPTSVADGAGGMIVAWHDYRSGHFDIYAQHVLASGEQIPPGRLTAACLLALPTARASPPTGRPAPSSRALGAMESTRNTF